jgi:TolB-like protein
MSLLAELQRRKVFKVGAAYLVVAWLAVQAASIAFPTFEAPPWALRVFILLCLLGFPLALVMAWIFDATPEGVKVDARGTGTKRVFGSAAVLVVLALGWYFYGQPAFRRAETAKAAAIAASVAAAAPAVATAPEKSIAVLPFVDMSENHDQEYFSDGIAEELLNRLAQFPDLSVAARTSAFQFKGKNLDVADIGRQLRVAHVLEGSVRKSGTRLRITAQLIDSRTGYHLWSETYDRDAADIFKVQDEISDAIGDALEARLGTGAAGSRPVSVDPQAYDDYLQGRALMARRLGDNLKLAVAAFDRAIARDPGYSAAHSGRAFASLLKPLWGVAPDPAAAMAAARGSAEKALQLDPKNAEAYMVRGTVAGFTYDFTTASADLDRALALAPGNVDVLNMDGDFRLSAGQLAAAERDKRLAMALDPLSFVHPMNLSDVLTAQGRVEEAAAAVESALALGAGGFGYDRQVFINARLGRFAVAQAAFDKACGGDPASITHCQGNQILLFANNGKRPQAKQVLDTIARNRGNAAPASPPLSASWIAALYVEVGDFAAATKWQRTALDEADWFPTFLLQFAPGGAKLPEELSRDPEWLAVWADPRLKDVMANFRRNLLAWRACSKSGATCH